MVSVDIICHMDPHKCSRLTFLLFFEPIALLAVGALSICAPFRPTAINSHRQRVLL